MSNLTRTKKFKVLHELNTGSFVEFFVLQKMKIKKKAQE